MVLVLSYSLSLRLGDSYLSNFINKSRNLNLTHSTTGLKCTEMSGLYHLYFYFMLTFSRQKSEFCKFCQPCESYEKDSYKKYMYAKTKRFSRESCVTSLHCVGHARDLHPRGARIPTFNAVQ